MSDEMTLLPCPFCGGEADKWNYIYWHVGCSIPGCAGYACQNDDYDTEAEAIAAWNTRAERTCRNTSTRLDESRFHCSECCDGVWVKHVSDGRDRLPNYCPNCGAKVVDA